MKECTCKQTDPSPNSTSLFEIFTATLIQKQLEKLQRTMRMWPLLVLLDICSVKNSKNIPNVLPHQPQWVCLIAEYDAKSTIQTCWSNERLRKLWNSPKTPFCRILQVNRFMIGHESSVCKRLSVSQAGMERVHRLVKPDCVKLITSWALKHFLIPLMINSLFAHEHVVFILNSELKPVKKTRLCSSKMTT